VALLKSDEIRNEKETQHHQRHWQTVSIIIIIIIIIGLSKTGVQKARKPHGCEPNAHGKLNKTTCAYE